MTGSTAICTTALVGAVALVACRAGCWTPANGPDPVPAGSKRSSQTAPAPAAKARPAAVRKRAAIPYNTKPRHPLQRDFRLVPPLFAPDSAWNQRADGAGVLPDSDKQILAVYRAVRAYNRRVTWMDIVYDDWSVAVCRLGKTRGKVRFYKYDGTPDWGTNSKIPQGAGKKGAVITLPMPSGTVRVPGPSNGDADGHLVLVDLAKQMTWDYWQPSFVRPGHPKGLGGGRVGAKIVGAGAVDIFDLHGLGTNYPKDEASARAMGVALLAGLLLPEDVAAGQIRHALAFGIPNPRNRNKNNPEKPLPGDVFYPAATLETHFFSTDPHQLAAGQRIRLKRRLVGADGAPLDEKQFAPITRMFLTALRQYGAYLVDNAGGLSFVAEDMHTARLDISDEQVNRLLGRDPREPIPATSRRWELLMRQLNDEVRTIPIALGQLPKGQDPRQARITIANWEVVEPATAPIKK